MTRTVGLDIGDKRIGVALSDPAGVLASPLTIIDRTNEPADIDTIIDIVCRNRAEWIVVGLPFSMDGGFGEQAEKVKDFIDRLREKTEIPVEFRDERLSSVSARRLMHAGSKKRKRQKARDDAVAAAVILQSYLEETLHSETDQTVNY